MQEQQLRQYQQQQQMDRQIYQEAMLYVEGLPPDVTEQEVLTAFHRFGATKVRLPKGRKKKEQGVAWIEMRGEEYVNGAIFNTNGHKWMRGGRTVGDRPVRVSRAWKSDRMG